MILRGLIEKNWLRYVHVKMLNDRWVMRVTSIFHLTQQSMLQMGNKINIWIDTHMGLFILKIINSFSRLRSNRLWDWRMLLLLAKTVLRLSWNKNKSKQRTKHHHRISPIDFGSCIDPRNSSLNLISSLSKPE